MSENKVNYIFGRHIIEPGGFYFGDNENEIYTLLGSCVAVTLWHPFLNFAGMCHVILPERGNEASNTRFAGCAVKKFIEEIINIKTAPSEYEVGVYGGGNMFPSIKINNKKLIGMKNFNEIERLLIKEGFVIKYKDVGGEVARKLTLSRLTGNISLEYVKLENI